MHVHVLHRARAATLARRLVVLTAMLAVIGLVPALPAVGTPPDSDVRTVLVDRWSGAPPAAGRTPSAMDWSTSAVLPADAVVAVGADWGGGDQVSVEVRRRRAGGWGEWTALRLVDDHGPDPASAEASRAAPTTTDPLWVGPSEALQVRQRGGGADLALRLHTVTVSGGDGLKFRPSAMPVAAAHAAPARPNVITRASWGADESIRKYDPYYAQDVRFAVVHHTAGSNDYSCDESDDLVRAIYEYHVNVQGWDDIAYNFLVDRCGQVFEGRAGGMTEPVVGAHAAGWNGGSTGVSVLGNFDRVVPPQAALDALDGLLAWKLDVHHVDPFGTTEELAGGGSSNRFDRNDRVTLPTIIGHRVTNSTSCPGDHLIPHIVDEHPEHPRSEPTARWEPVAAQRVQPIGTPKAYGGPSAEREQPLTGHRPRWDVDFTESLDWRLQIRDDRGQVVRSTGGYEATSIDLTWDLRDGDGVEVPPGTYTGEMTSWTTTSTASAITTTFDVRPAAERLAGADRVATALELSRWAFDSATRVVIATSRSYADALTATPLAGSFGVPILLTPPDHLPDELAEEIERLGADEAWIVGGTGAVSGQVARDLTGKAGIDADEVHRLAGPDRFATAYEVADEVLHREGSTEVLVAVGRHADERRAFPDALSAGGLGAEFDLPIVLVERDRLPSATRQFLAEHDLSDGVQLFGGTAAIGPGVESAIRDAARVEVRRFAGEDRYDTSRLAAEDALRRWAEFEDEIGGPNPYLRDEGLEVVLASGANWPDALGAGAAADERRRSVFLLTPPTEVSLSGPTAAFFGERADEITHAVVSGGAGAVSDEVVRQLDELVRLDGPHAAPAEDWPDDPHAIAELPLPGPTGGPSPSPQPAASPSPEPSTSPSPEPSASPSGPVS